MKVPGTKRIVELDFIRGLAILAVINFHAASYRRGTARLGLLENWPFHNFELHNFGWAGVDLFFVLSGFLVGGLLCEEWKKKGAVKPGRFLLRRGFKIWPAYYFYLLFQVVLHRHPISTYLWQNALHIQNYTGTVLFFTWSLAVEEHFYILLAIAIAWASARHCSPKNFLIVCAAISVLVAGYRTYLSNIGTPHNNYTHTRIDPLLIGVMIALLFHFYPNVYASLQRRTLALSITLAVSLVTVLALDDNNPIGVQFIAAELGSAALFLLLFRPGRPRGRVYRLVAAIGVYSYGIYLWHYSVIPPTLSVFFHLPGALMYLRYPVTVLLGIALGVAMTRLVEFPMLRVRERFVPTQARYELNPRPSAEQPVSR